MVNQDTRAFKTWNILVELAPRGKTITYEDLAKVLGTHHRADRYFLEKIQRYCKENRLPPLTILVVNKQTNLPGEGFTGVSRDNLTEGRTDVRTKDWSREQNPFSYAADGTTEDELINRILTQPEASQEVYAKVKVRGTAQMLFRSALLKAYNGRCAFTGISFPETLDSAHIIPWSQCTHELKMDPRNGILMLCCHHRLFDLGVLSVDEDYRIVFTNRNGSILTEADHLLVEGLHGRQIVLPINVALRPDKNLIHQRNLALGLQGPKVSYAKGGKRR